MSTLTVNDNWSILYTFRSLTVIHNNCPKPSAATGYWGDGDKKICYSCKEEVPEKVVVIVKLMEL